jgi:uncharacterized membrane protein
VGDAILVLLGIGAAGYVLLVPGIALALALQANARREALEARVRDLERQLASLQRADLDPMRPPALAQPLAEPIAAPAEPIAAPVEPIAAPVEPIAAPPLLQLELQLEPPPPAAAAPPDGVLPPAEATPPEEAAPPTEEAAPPAVGPPPPKEQEQDAARPPSLEEHLGLTWLTRIGAAAFLLGALFFFKYAVDNEWIGPTGRVAIGAFVGIVLIAAAEAVQKKTKPRFVQALIGIGLATLFVSVWASAAFYRLIDGTAALVVNTVILFFGVALSLRHRGEPILILALIAGFLNPIVLSTGQDRPLELFSYLLLITSAAHGVAYRLRFRIVPALAVVGVVALFGGWYGKFFDASDRRSFLSIDAVEATLVGPYFALDARIVPLVFVGLFAAQWIAFALLLQATSSDAKPAPSDKAQPAEPASSTPQIRGLVLAALVLAHVGAAILIFDHPRVLAGIAIGVAGLAILLLRRIEAKHLLVIPMGAAFLAFLAVSPAVPDAQRTTMVGLLGVWTVVYLIGFLRGVSRPDGIPAAVAISCAVGAGLFDALAGALLLTTKPALFVFLLGFTSAIVAFLASRSERRSLRVLALFATLGALLLTAVLHSDFNLDDGLPRAVAIDPVFLTAAGVWALIYLGAVLEDALQRRAKITWETTITASLATLGFLTTALLGTGSEVPTLRALLTAAAGVADLFAGALLLQAASKDREPVVLLLGQALGLFAVAIAFGLSGAPVTVLWAALAVVAVAVAARTREQSWLTLGSLLFVATLVRLLAIDVAAVQASVGRFFASAGREGVIAVPLLFNARAYALAGTGLGLLTSAFLLTRDAGSPFRRPAALAAILGYGLLVSLAILEVRTLAFHPPPAPPYPLDAPEWAAFMKHYENARFAQRGWMAMSTTLVMAIAAALLLVAGFIAREAFHRYLGLCLFLLTVLKLALWDVWNIERIYQIILLTGVGALLVSGGFLYARFGRRLVALMREGPGARGSAALILLALLSAAARAEADPARLPPLPVSTFPVMRPVQGVASPGDHFFEVDADLYRASRGEALLGDLRIAGPDGAEVPYVIRDIASLRSPRKDEVIEGTMLDPSLGSGGAVYASFRLKSRQDHCRVELDLDGDAFLRKVSVETGEDPRSLGLLLSGPYVFRVRQAGASGVEHVVVPYPRSQASLVRITLLPEGASASVRIRGGRFSCPQKGDAERDRPVSTHPLTIEDTALDDATKTTVLTLDAAAEGLPIEALLLDVGTAEFSRRVEVTATSYRSVWPEAGGGMIYRVAGREGPIELLRVPIGLTRKRWFKLVVHNEDSAPLTLRGVFAEVRRRTVTLRAAQAGGHVLYAGDPARAAPRYDLAEILARGDSRSLERPLLPVTLGAVAQNPWFGLPDRPENLPVTERYRTPIGVALSAVLVGLSIWALLLLRKPAKPVPPPDKAGEGG